MTQIGEDIKKEDGLTKLIEFVKGIYGEEEFKEVFDNYMEFEDIKRDSSESIKEFIILARSVPLLPQGKKG